MAGAVTTMPTPSEEHLRDLLAQAEQDLMEAEQRREHTARILAGPHDGMEAQAFAERLLREIDWTIAFIRANRNLLELILD